ncbi:MAG: glycosyltransferase [Lachnospiraceae bacterium]
MKRILVSLPLSSYRALEIFARELIEAWRHMGIEVDVIGNGSSLDRDIEFSLHNQYDVIFSLNQTFPNIDVDGKTVLEKLDAPYFSYIVDHPMHLYDRLDMINRQKGCICVDSSFQDYLRQYYSFPQIEVVMQAGIEGNYAKRPFRERKHNIVFCGTYRSSKEILEMINKGDESIRGVLSLMIEEGLKNSDMTIEAMLWNVIRKYGLDVQEEDFAECMADCRLVEYFMRGYYREQVIGILLGAGIPVEVYGSGWEYFQCANKELLSCHEDIDYMDMLNVFSDSKIVLNIMPWAKNGFHDRIACSMLNGALSVSDATSYLIDNHLDSDKMLVYSLKELNSLPERIQYYLNHLEEAEEIARNGYNWAKENHLWSNRAEQLLQIFGGYYAEYY